MTDETNNCPKCDHPLTQVGQFWVCPQHGQISLENTVARLRIFLSYGHDSNEELVRLIKVDLENRGHDVWFDKSAIKAGDDWRRAITDGIAGSHKFVSFLSKHSTRDPGVCLDEIAIAIGVKGGNIQTILVESETEVKPPASISHIQWLDMHDWKEQRAAGESAWEVWYQAKLAEIVRVVESEENRRFAGEIETLSRHLKPISPDSRIGSLLQKGFVGRIWLMEALDEWCGSADRSSRLFWIVGDPGVGKSAFAAHLAHFGRDKVIAAQFVEWDKPDHRNARRVVRSLAFQIATRLPDYRKLLLTLPEIAELGRKGTAELFDYLLANPLRSVIGGGRGRYLVVIDALDEAGEADRNPLVEMLAQNAPRLPDWLSLVVTSRPESAVRTPLQGLPPFVVDTHTDANRADLRDYLRHHLAPQFRDRPDADRLVEQVLEKSEGVFLYVERFCDDVLRGHLSLDCPEQFPQGLGGIFCQWFQRQFPDLEEFRKDIRPVLRAILAAREPLPIEVLQRLSNWQDEELRDFTRILGSLFSVTKGANGAVVKPYHKSLTDWLADERKAGPYFVSVAQGHQLLADYAWRQFETGNIAICPYSLRHLLVHLAETSDDERLHRCFDEGFLARKRDAGVSLDEVQEDFRRGLDYFALKGDSGLMLSVASSHHRDTESQQLPKYESYLIWLSSCLRWANDSMELARTIRYIEAQPEGADRVRMAAEMLIGLGDHPQAVPLRERMRTRLEETASIVEEDGLDLLAAEALGELDRCFELALTASMPAGQRLCRILKLIRRHPNHRSAPGVVEELLKSVPGASEFKLDHVVVLASTGLLGRGWAADQIRWQAVEDLGRTGERGQKSGLTALTLSAFLADRPEMLDHFVDFAAAEPPAPPALLHATLVMAWFDGRLTGEPLIERVLASRSVREDVWKGALSGRGRILRAMLGDFELLQDAAMHYTIKPNEALLVPLFALWARLVTSVEDVPTDDIHALARLSPAYDTCFERDVRILAEWIELGQSLCCVDKTDAAQRLLSRLHELANGAKKPGRWSGLAMVGSAVLFLFFPLMFGTMAVGVSAVLLILVIVALLGLNLVGAVPQAAVLYRWLRREPVPTWVLRSWEERYARGLSPPIWARWGNTWMWQILAVMFEDAGRPHLAAAIVANKTADESGNFFRELRPCFFRQPQHFTALLSHYERLKSESAEANREQWLRLAREMESLNQSRANGGLVISALPLVAQGQLTLMHVIKMSRRFHPSRRAAIESLRDIDELGATIASLAEPSDLLEACQAVRHIRLSSPHRLAAALLLLSSSRTRPVFAELLHHISRWPGLASRDASRQMRASYVDLVREQYRVPRWFRHALLFPIIRGAYWAMRVTFREGYNRPADFARFTMKAIWRRLRRW